MIVRCVYAQAGDLEMKVCRVKPDSFIVTAQEDFKEVI